MSDVLLALKDEIASGRPLSLQKDGTEADINAANEVQLNGQGIPITSPTRFARNETPFDLRTIIFAWLNKDLGATEYIQTCQDKNILNLSFVEKNDLIAYLSGQQSTLSAEKRAAETQENGDAKRQTLQSDIVKRIYAQEHRTKPFSICLHGKKEVDFSQVQKDAREYFLVQKAARPTSSNGAKPDKPKSRLRDPIILLSPSASSLITMHNIKRFLEEGVFVPPDVAARETGGPAPEVLSLAYKSKLQQGKTLRFVVVESTDKFKPDYWDRLLVVFTTGQAWQFKPYAPQFSDPRSLFQRTKGILVRYADEPINAAERDWNVQGIQINRAQRYNDRVIVSTFWDSVERWMEEKGKKEFYRHERRQ